MVQLTVLSCTNKQRFTLTINVRSNLLNLFELLSTEKCN